MEKLQPSPHLPSSMRNVHRMCLFTLSWRGSGCRKWQLGHGEAVHGEPSVSFCQLQTQQDMAAQSLAKKACLPLLSPPAGSLASTALIGPPGKTSLCHLEMAVKQNLIPWPAWIPVSESKPQSLR